MSRWRGRGPPGREKGPEPAQTGNIIPYGLMIRTFAEGENPEFFRSPVDNRAMVPWYA
jgi:hypothetical protein